MQGLLSIGKLSLVASEEGYNQNPEFSSILTRDSDIVLAFEDNLELVATQEDIFRRYVRLVPAQLATKATSLDVQANWLCENATKHLSQGFATVNLNEVSN